MQKLDKSCTYIYVYAQTYTYSLIYMKQKGRGRAQALKERCSLRTQHKLIRIKQVQDGRQANFN